MRITQYTDYALRVLLYLGAAPERLATIAEIAERYAISRSHLMKVVSQLVQEGVVTGVRGKGGGLRLAVAPAAINIGEVVRKIEADLVLVECFGDDNQCLIASRCRLKRVLNQALAAFLAVLDSYTLADLLINSDGLRQVLQLSDQATAGRN